MSTYKGNIIQSNFDSWSSMALYIHKKTLWISLILIVTIILIIMFVVIKNLITSNNQSAFSDCNISYLLLRLIKEYYNVNTNYLNGYSAFRLLSKDEMSNTDISSCMDYIKSKIWYMRKDDNRFFSDTPVISNNSFNFNNYRIIMFVAQQYNSAIIFNDDPTSIFFKQESEILEHLNQLLLTYSELYSFNNMQIIRLIDPNFDFYDFELFIRLSIFLCALHLKL